MSEKEQAQILKQLREEHKETIDRARALLKQQQIARREIKEALDSGPKTVPEIADHSSLASHEVMWHLMAMKKFGLVEELEMDGQYYRYQLVQEQAK